MKKFQRHQWGSVAVRLPELSFSDRLLLFAALISVLIFSFPQVALAHDEPPFIFIVNQERLQAYLTQEIKPWEDQILKIAGNEEQGFSLILVPIDPDKISHDDPRIDKLRAYLSAKKSPMANHVPALLANQTYRFIIAISFAESNFCKVNIRPHNCWGIGGNYPEIYSDYPAAFERANSLIQKYHDQGMTTPRLMRNTWVGWHNNNWILAVEQVLHQLEELGI